MRAKNGNINGLLGQLKLLGAMGCVVKLENGINQMIIEIINRSVNTSTYTVLHVTKQNQSRMYDPPYLDGIRRVQIIGRREIDGVNPIISDCVHRNSSGSISISIGGIPVHTMLLLLLLLKLLVELDGGRWCDIIIAVDKRLGVRLLMPR